MSAGEAGTGGAGWDHDLARDEVARRSGKGKEARALAALGLTKDQMASLPIHADLVSANRRTTWSRAGIVGGFSVMFIGIFLVIDAGKLQPGEASTYFVLSIALVLVGAVVGIAAVVWLFRGARGHDGQRDVPRSGTVSDLAS